MGNKLSPGCCCGKCDIFRTEFDLRYMVDAPPVTTDWVNALQPRTSAPRLYCIRPGNPGESMLFSQSLNNVSSVPPLNKQLYYPTYAEHPDPGPIRELFGPFPASSFIYQIRNPTGSAVPGHYRLTSTQRLFVDSFFSPIATLNFFRAEPWTDYWRHNWTLHDEHGIVDNDHLPDAVPFVLQVNQSLISKRRMPSEWWTLDCFRLLYGTWFNTDQELTIELIDDNDDVAAAIQVKSLLVPHPTISDFSQQSTRIELQPGGVTAQRRGTDLARWWWIIRDYHYEFHPVLHLPANNLPPERAGSGGTPENPEWSITRLWDVRRDLPQQQIHAVRNAINGPLGRCRVRIRHDNPEGIKLGSIAAANNHVPHLERNLDCTDRRTQVSIAPYDHLRWRLHDLTISGMTATERQLSMYGPVTVFTHGENSTPPISSSVVVPVVENPQADGTVIYQGWSYFNDNHPVLRRPHSLSADSGTLPVQLSPGVIGGFPTEGWDARVRVRVLEHETDSVRVRIELIGVYRSHPGISAAGNYDSVQFDGMYLIDTMQGGSGLVTAGNYAFEPVPAGSHFGWLTVTGVTYENQLGLRRQLHLTWERIVPRWQGTDFPTIEVLGSEIDWESQSHGPLIYAMTSFSLSIASPLSPFTANVSISGTAEEIDLNTLSLTIGPPVL